MPAKDVRGAPCPRRSCKSPSPHNDTWIPERLHHALKGSGEYTLIRPQLPTPTPEKPEILAPAGDTACFLSALAAGADNIYLGLKQFSARMQAENFGLIELSRLTDLAHENEVRVTVAMNNLLKENEVDAAARLLRRLETQVGCDGVIVQDLAMVELARDVGFEGSITLSTLANVTHPGALRTAKELGVSRVVLPRELNIDEIRMMGESCPDGLELECFVHGALCYCVSGRCYWSSYMGGKSGLRGRCVQPCRRVYTQGPETLLALQKGKGAAEAKDGRRQEARDARKGQRPDARGQGRGRRPEGKVGKNQSGRYFSCQDLSVDVLAKTLLGIPHLLSWKIEGRKKGPHYVYHTVTAYRILRDNPNDNKAKKMAEEILEMALGRPSTHAHFLPQRGNVPVDPSGQTSSGLLVGKVQIAPNGAPCIKPYQALQVKDYLRIGLEDDKWHATLPVTRPTPKAGTFYLRVPRHKTPKAGVPVYLIDRRDVELEKILAQWTARLESMPDRRTTFVEADLPRLVPARRTYLPAMTVHASLPQGKETRGARNFLSCLWLTRKSAEISRTTVRRFGWWLPPVMWTEEENEYARMVNHLWREGARTFVCNAPWQVALFEERMLADETCFLVAGPFCNIANARTAKGLMDMGFKAGIVSPELNRDTLLALPKDSPLPLGYVQKGAWPVGISRFGTLGVRLNEPFASPKGELFWARQYGQNVWIYPAWQMDIGEKRDEMEKAGYMFSVTLQERPPASLPEQFRPGLFNWENPLL